MTRVFRSALIAVAAMAFFQCPLQAQDAAPIHLFDSESFDAKVDFIRMLRKKNNGSYALLAKEFTDQLIKTSQDKNQITMLNLENARTAVAMAKEQRRDQRGPILEQARQAFEPFIKANPNSPAGTQARVEMAKLFILQAQMKLNSALANEDSDQKLKGMREAVTLYDAADGEFEQAIKAMAASNQKQAAIEAEFERGLCLLEKIDAYDTASQNRPIAESIAKAIGIFTEIAKDRDSPNGLMAVAHLARCYALGQDPPKVAEMLGIIANAKGPGAYAAMRQARYYDALYVKIVPDFKHEVYKSDRQKALFELANEWFKSYPADKSTNPGEHLHFEQATYYHIPKAQAMCDGGFTEKGYAKVKANPKDKAVFDAHLAAAHKIGKDLEADGGDYSERGQLIYKSVDYIKSLIDKTPGKTPQGFEGLLTAAGTKFREATKKLDDKSTGSEADAQKLFRDGQLLLTKAINAGEAENVSPGKIHEAQFLLGSAYYGMNDRRRAAVSFEALARANPPSKKSAEAGAFAIDLYKHFIDTERDESARYYMHELAKFILGPDRQKLWESDPVIGLTRYNLALDLRTEDKYAECLDQLAALPKDFQAYTYSQGQAVFIALQAREKAETPEDKRPWTDKAKAALARMGPLPATADPTSILMWFTASVEGPKFLYAEAAEILRNEEMKEDEKIKKAGAVYEQMFKSVAALDAIAKKDGGKLAPDKKSAVDFTVHVLDKYARLGLADIEYRKGNYGKILGDEFLGPVIKEVVELAKNQKDAKDKIPVKDVRVVGESLSLVLRSYIQEGKLDQAIGVYNFLMRLAPESGEAQDNANFTRALIDDLEKQVKGMKERNETDKLKETTVKFSVFGDMLAKTLVYEQKKPELRDIKNLVRFYTSLDQFKKGADLINKVPAPKFLETPKFKATEEQERELFIYWDFQVEYGKLLRQSKDWEGANKILNRVMTHENARYQTVAEMERNFIYEDRETYGAAIKSWKEFMEKLQRADLKNNKIKELYFDGFYHNVYCFYKQSQKPESIKAGTEQKYLTYAANQIVRLENSQNREGWQIIGPKFTELMNKEKKLKAAYETAKKSAAK